MSVIQRIAPLILPLSPDLSRHCHMMANVKNYIGLVKKSTHSSVDGHLGYFHFPAIVNSAAMNTEVHVSFSVLFSSRVYA